MGFWLVNTMALCF